MPTVNIQASSNYEMDGSWDTWNANADTSTAMRAWKSSSAGATDNRIVVLFDLSSIPVSATVNSCSLYIDNYAWTFNDVQSYLSFQCLNGNLSDTPPGQTDYTHAGPAESNGITLRTFDDFNDWWTTPLSIHPSYLNKGGYWQLLLSVFTPDELLGDYVDFHTIAYDSGSHCPYLAIDYTPAATGAPPMSLMGVGC